jgi:hypothetical protein
VLWRGDGWATTPAEATACGTPGEWLNPHVRTADFGMVDIGNGCSAIQPGDMYCAHEATNRSPANDALHWLDDDVLASTRRVAPVTGPTARRAEVWDAIVRVFQTAVRSAQAGEFWVVTSNSTYQGYLAEPPAHLVSGTTGGVFFTSAAALGFVHPDWVVAYVPLRATEGRLLAGARMVATVAGRADMTFAIINGTNPRAHPIDRLGEARRAGFPTLSITQAMTTVNAGAFFSAGCIFRADRREVRSSFAEYGHTYGWDEAILVTRTPNVWHVDACADRWHAVAFGRSLPGAVVFSRSDAGIFSGRYVARFSRHIANLVWAGDTLPLGGAAPYPLCNRGWASLDWGAASVRGACRKSNIPLLGDETTPRLPRVGGRYHWVNTYTDNSWETEDLPGAVWRSFEIAAGLRDRLAVETTQGLAPALFKEAVACTLEREEQRVFRRYLESAARAIARWAESQPQGEVIAVASVGSPQMASDFIEARGDLFTRWVFLSEHPRPAALAPGTFWAHLPVLYGSGNSFQLARLLPGLYSPATTVFTVVNDLETDWLPRDQRLAVGLSALKHYRAVCPAMHANSSCPFQDICYYGDAFLDKGASLLDTIAKWGWVYGMDEVWLSAHHVPTALIANRLGGAAATRKANPTDAVLLTADPTAPGAFREHLAPKGNFRSVLSPSDNSEGGIELKVPPGRAAALTWAFRARRAFGLLPAMAPRLRIYEPQEWDDYGAVTWAAVVASGEKAICFTTWGTRGDRVPILAGARAAWKTGRLHVFVRHLVTEAEGKHMLQMCEEDRSYEFLPDLARTVAKVARMPGNVIKPDYLSWSGGLSYSLRPSEDDAQNPGGGYPAALDWIVQLVFWRDRARVRVGVREGLKWFPRSADGHSMLVSVPRRTPGAGKRGVCIGSSSLPVPEAYAGWERVPDGDHWQIAQAYDEIVCDGGAGKVDTFRAAGVPIVRSTNNKIDRKWHDPDNAGATVTRNEPAEKWVLCAAWFYPSLAARFCGWKPARWANFIAWRANFPVLAGRVWHLMFLAYCFRYKNLLPSIEATAIYAVAPLPSAGLWRAAMVFISTRLIKAAADARDVTPLALLLELAHAFMRGLFAPATSVLIALGWNAITATILGGCIASASLAPLSQATIATPLAGADPTVWLVLTPVWAARIPIGLHAGLYQPSSGRLWEGAPVTGREGLGTPFRLRIRTIPEMRPLFAVRTSLAAEHLPTTSGRARPYSAIHNCQTIVLGLMLRHGKQLIAAEMLLLVLGTGYAMTTLLIGAVVAALAATVSWVMLWAVVPVDAAFPALNLGPAVERVVSGLSVNLLWFAGEADPPTTGYTSCTNCGHEGHHGTLADAYRATANAECDECGHALVALQNDVRAATWLSACDDCNDTSAWPTRTAATGAPLCGAPGHGSRTVAHEPRARDTMIRDTAALFAADAIRMGIDETTVFQAIAEAVPFADIESDHTERTVEDELPPLLFQERRGPSAIGRSSFSAWASEVARNIAATVGLQPCALEGFAALCGAILQMGENVTLEFVVLIAQALDALHASGMVQSTNGFLDWVNNKFNTVTTTSDRRKNVWAVLSKKRLERLRRGELLALSLKTMRMGVPTKDAIPWMTALLNKHHDEGDPLDEEFEYAFPSWLPHRPRVSEQEYAYPSLLHEVEAAIDPELTARVTEYLSLGGQVGLDGMWAATDEMREKVTSRYFSEPPNLTPADLDYASELANMLFESHPEAFDAPAIVRPETVRSRLNMKGRPGLPFIQKVRTRRALESTGWMKSIISATYECLETGEFPPDAYTEFAKMMVLPAATVTSKGPRTIMATSLLTNFVSGVYELERRTRKTWPTTDIGLGAPLTADYLGKVFEKVAARQRVFVADATAYDANVPPILFEVLAVLGDLGARNSIPSIATALRAKYIRLQNALIVDLPTGKIWVKSRGGATGQSATSWDNTWSMRALMIGAWARATGLPMNEFYLHNTVHNTGDDNVWGTDSDVTPEALSAAAKELFGVDVRIEFEGVEALSYLSKQAIRVADRPEIRSEILRVLPVVPEWTAMHDASRLLARRGAVVSRFAGAPYQAYKRHLAERSVGHALLCVHNRGMFDLLANEWMEDVRKYVAARPYAVIFETDRQADGHIEGVRARFTATYEPTSVQAKRMKEITKGALKFPTYQRVLEVSYTTKPTPELSQYAKVKVMPTFEAVVREQVVRARLSFHAWLPDALVKLSPSPGAAPHSAIVTVWGFPVEKYVWRTMSPDATLTEFASELRQSPYASSTDATGFWWYLEIPGVREELLATSMQLIRGRMVTTTAVYMALTEIVHIMRASRLGLLVEAWQIYTQDAPRLFSLLDSLHWLDTGRSSPVISTLTPKDPYATQKHVAVWAATFVWDGFAVLIGAWAGLGIMARLAELIAYVRLLRVAQDLDLALKTPHDNRWPPHLPAIKAALVEGNNAISLSAPTSTGKSTELPAALLREENVSVWMVVHTRYLRDSYRNPWVPPTEQQMLAAGVNRFPARLYICTYGHFCARLAAMDGPGPADYVILDEFHARLPIQGIASHRICGHARVIHATATPDDLYLPPACPHISVPLEREWAEVVPCRLNLAPMELFKEAKESGLDTKRVLFILPTVAAVDAVTQALLSMGEHATAVTAKRRSMPSAGHVVATPVAEAGVNISPPATGLVDSGLTVSQSLGILQTRPTNPSEHIQRLGRVARRGEGWAFVNTVAGSGETPLPYPTYLDLVAAGPSRGWLLDRIEVADDFEPIFSPGSVDPHMRLAVPEEMARDTRTSLSAWWLMSLSTGSPSKANRLYDQVTITGWPEELDAVSNLLGSSRYIVPRALIQRHIESMPFEVRRNGHSYRPLTLIVRKGAIEHYP